MLGNQVKVKQQDCIRTNCDYSGRGIRRDAIKYEGKQCLSKKKKFWQL